LNINCLDITQARKYLLSLFMIKLYSHSRSSIGGGDTPSSLRISITAMSYGKSVAEGIVLAQSEGLQLHFLKILRAPDHLSANHWCQEVNAFLGKANKAATNVKTSKGSLSRESVASLLLSQTDSPRTILSILEGMEFPDDLYRMWFPNRGDSDRFAEVAFQAFESGLRDLALDIVLSKELRRDHRLTIEKITSFSQPGNTHHG
jgi:hypothetical protein